MKKFVPALAVAALLASGTLVSAGAMAQTSDSNVVAHPRVNGIDERLENQQQRIDNGVQQGQINSKQEMRDEKTDAKVSQELSTDEAKHNGHITKAEQTKMNKQLDHNSKRIHHQRHKGAAVPASTPATTPSTP
jgi:hypothetical protein